MSAIAAAYEEYDQFMVWAWNAERAGRHSDARHYRRMAQDALLQLRQEDR